RTATALSAGSDAKWRNPLPPGPHHAPNAAPRMRGRFARCKWGASVESGSLCFRNGRWNGFYLRETHATRPTAEILERYFTTRASQRPTSRFTNGHTCSLVGSRLTGKTANNRLGYLKAVYNELHKLDVIVYPCPFT